MGKFIGLTTSTNIVENGRLPRRMRALVVRWETLENHTVDFRGSDGFLVWRNLIARYLAGPLEVENTEPIGVGF